jgi:hypothetical protein
MLRRKRELRSRPIWIRIVDLIPSSSWLWDLLEGGSPQARQLSADSIAIFRIGKTRRHPTILSTQPDSRLKRCRSKTAPATHQDQGGEDLRTRSPAPGAMWRPRKSSSSAGRVHKVEITRASGCLLGRHHLLAHGRRADQSLDEWLRDRPTHPYWFLQHLTWFLSRSTQSSENLVRVEVDLVLHDVVGRPCKLVGQCPDSDDAVGRRHLSLKVLLGRRVIADSMMRCF